MLQKLGRMAGLPLVATASCYLGLLASLAFWDSPRFIVAALTDAELYHVAIRGLVPRFLFLPPSEASLPAFALYSAGSIVLAALALVLGPIALQRLKGWGRLLAAFTLFWLGLLVVESAAAFALRGRGSLATLLRVLGPADLGAPLLPVLLAAATGILVFALLFRVVRALHGASGDPAPKRLAFLLLGFAVPLVALTLMPQTAILGWWLRRLGVDLAPAVLALTVTVAVAWKPGRAGRPFEARVAGGAVTLLACTIVSAAILHYPDLVRRAKKAEFDIQETGHWKVFFEKGALDPGQRVEWALAADRRTQALASRLSLNIEGETWSAEVHLSSTSRRASGNEPGDDDSISIDSHRRSILHLLNPDGGISDPRGEALLLLFTEWGEPGSDALAMALSRYAVARFYGHDLASYARRIACEERPYSLREVLGLDPSYLSPLVRDAMSGAWVEWLAEDLGDEVLPLVYRTRLVAGEEEDFARAIGTSWESMEESWRRKVTQDVTCQAEAREVSARAEPKQLGISFSHEYGGGWGYGSDIAQQQLERIRDVGATSISIVPYAFTRAPDSAWIRFRTDETDERMVRTIQRARQLGLEVMLKPHLWAGGRFTGDIVFRNESDFQMWFSQYRRWLLHFARFAEIHGLELLSVGNELAGVTSHETEWRELIRDVRRVYRGPLTYAAHWDGEFETIAFWDDLDHVGVNFYFPLALRGELPQAYSPRMQEVTAAIESVSRSFAKPVLFTEVGFPSVATAAAEPWRETNAAFDLALQRQCYEAVFQAFLGRPWFAGLYWWKWPTHGRGGPYEPSHNPIGKPALKVVERWYQQPPLDHHELSE